MALAYEGNTNLAFDTAQMKNLAAKYVTIAQELRSMAKELDNCLTDLKNDGWTTPAGSAFQKMAETNWEQNIEKYAALLDTLKAIIDNATNQYESLAVNHIEKTKLS